VNPIITASLTGPVATKKENPAVPGSPEEIAQSAKEAYEAGAAVIHIHLREHDGFTTDVDVARRTVEAVRAVCPGIVQLSTGGGFAYEDRMGVVEAMPAMATLNPGTMTIGDGEFRNPPKLMYKLAERMLKLGIKAEVEIYDTGHLGLTLDLLKRQLLSEPLQVSFVMGVKGGMPADPRLLGYLVNELPSGTSWQVIAIGKANLPLTSIGLAMGGNARTGLEDTLMIRPRELASSNAQLVEALVNVAQAQHLRPATVDEVIERLKLSRDLIGRQTSGEPSGASPRL
jgi:3-keto-5-aminohexanoate cleavage enzyme